MYSIGTSVKRTAPANAGDAKTWRKETERSLAGGVAKELDTLNN